MTKDNTLGSDKKPFLSVIYVTTEEYQRNPKPKEQEPPPLRNWIKKDYKARESQECYEWLSQRKDMLAKVNHYFFIVI